jgi:hypothetical protein
MDKAAGMQSVSDATVDDGVGDSGVNRMKGGVGG